MTQDAPEPPFLLVSNHLSYLDIFVLFSKLRCLFVAKSDVKAWPFIGFLVRTCGILFIDRNRKRDVTRVNQLISKNITENQGIILFPEGTTSPGFDVLPFRSSLLEYPASNGFPVSCVSISYQTKSGEDPAFESVCWWADTPFFSHFLTLLGLRGIQATLHFSKELISLNDRKQLTSALEDAVRDNFDPVISKEEFYKNYPDYAPVVSI